MGVFDFVKHGTGEMQIGRTHTPDEAREPIVAYSEPSVPLFGQLVVDDDDAAVFARDGKVIGIVGPGRHVLHPSKLPFLEGVAIAG